MIQLTQTAWTYQLSKGTVTVKFIGNSVIPLRLIWKDFQWVECEIVPNKI